MRPGARPRAHTAILLSCSCSLLVVMLHDRGLRTNASTPKCRAEYAGSTVQCTTGDRLGQRHACASSCSAGTVVVCVALKAQEERVHPDTKHAGQSMTLLGKQPHDPGAAVARLVGLGRASNNDACVADDWDSTHSGDQCMLWNVFIHIQRPSGLHHMLSGRQG